MNATGKQHKQNATGYAKSLRAELDLLYEYLKKESEGLDPDSQYQERDQVIIGMNEAERLFRQADAMLKRIEEIQWQT